MLRAGEGISNPSLARYKGAVTPRHAGAAPGAGLEPTLVAS